MKLNIKIPELSSIGLLPLGICLMYFSHLNNNLDVLAWVAMVPFLIFLQKHQSTRIKLMFLMVLILTWSVIISKIISSPIPVLFIFLYSIPIALIHFPGYFIWNRFRSSNYAPLVFASAMTNHVSPIAIENPTM